jgi:hypothetical protein
MEGNHSRNQNNSRPIEHRPAELFTLPLVISFLRSSIVWRISVLIASAAITASTKPAAAAERTSIKDIDASRSRWETLRSQPAKAADNKTCRADAAYFSESVMLRQAVARCACGERNLAVLNSEINVFNDLLATKCGG